MHMTGHAQQLSTLLVVLSAAGRAGALPLALAGVGAGAGAVGAGAGAGAAFPGSRLVSPAQGARLNSWANQPAGRRWALCYTSFTMGKTAAVFHESCDQYTPGMV